ncbi:Hypothetical predicted protein [Olea europaea subsp. europaea]|uniref:Uncharacterized protein n=1 Tax=Olea europaea subsp. europaea TaxID=158383 RepID=A0A8S0PU91_OLEEU|nr:Hypothetical predicted protein [Olea europaea subsp. europaea]
MARLRKLLGSPYIYVYTGVGLIYRSLARHYIPMLDHGIYALISKRTIDNSEAIVARAKRAHNTEQAPPPQQQALDANTIFLSRQLSQIQITYVEFGRYVSTTTNVLEVMQRTQLDMLRKLQRVSVQIRGFQLSDDQTYYEQRTITYAYNQVHE